MATGPTKNKKKTATKKARARKPAATKQAAAKRPAAKKKPVAKRKPAAKKPAAKKPAAKKPAALSRGLKEALAIAANEVLVESLEMIAEDPEGFLDGGDLGATYQSPIGVDTMAPADVEGFLRDLAAWDPKGASQPWERLRTAMFAAGMDFARALVHLATGAGELPAGVAPHQGSLRHVVRALEKALAEGYYDDEELGALLGDSDD